jgi:hypothetical protein
MKGFKPFDQSTDVLVLARDLRRAALIRIEIGIGHLRIQLSQFISKGRNIRNRCHNDVVRPAEAAVLLIHHRKCRRGQSRSVRSARVNTRTPLRCA